MKTPIQHAIAPVMGLVLFAIAIWVLHRNLAEYDYQDVIAAMANIPHAKIVAALALTALSYFVLTAYDRLAMRYIARPLPWTKVGLAAAVSYAFSNTIGMSVLTSGSVRYRLYSSWGLSPEEIAKVVIFCTVTLWLGILTLGGITLLLEPLVFPEQLGLPLADSRAIGSVMLAVAVTYLLVTGFWRQPLRIRAWLLEMPSPEIASLQSLVGSLDWIVAGAVLYVILPATESLGFVHFLAIFIAAQTVGLISHIPGGLGVFESMILLLLPPEMPSATALSALLIYRLIYYLLPLILATLTLGCYEALRQKRHLAWLPKLLGPWILALLPQIYALMALISGAVLLFSAATPAVESRMDWLEGILPLSIVEASHFTSSLVGTGLLLLARSLQRRLNAAYLLAVALLAIGITISLLKGADYEEATVLAILLIALLPSQREFYRKASLIDQRYTAGWIATIAVVLSCAVWLGFFSYKNVEYSRELWWQFSFGSEGDASRFLRSMVGVLVTVLFFAIAKLLRPAPPPIALPATADLDSAKTVAAECPHTYAHLALLGDKSLMFNSARNAFIMYGVEGRTWVAMGDPLGSVEEMRELAWKFREMCEYHNGWTVFYQVRPENLGLYLELGLTLLKIGEEARVPLANFSLAGKQGKSLRSSINRIVREGCHFEIIPPAAVPALLGQLKSVSDAWLAGKNTREKGFSLGYFDKRYLANCPIALVRREQQLIAFANLWLGGQKEELSLDLMRHLPDTPPGLMDYLFTELMSWGKDQGYRWFNLGMAPLAGLQSRTLAPLWNRFGALMFGHGERFYNFQGVHQFKEKFDPEWEARYLAVPSGIALPRILTNLSALIAGGLKGVVRK